MRTETRRRDARRASADIAPPSFGSREATQVGRLNASVHYSDRRALPGVRRRIVLGEETSEE